MATWQATILGSGTSTGVPTIGSTDPVCLSPDPRNFRLRAGLLLREPNVPTQRARTIVVDCGPDFHKQAIAHRIDRLDALLVTHAHFDHVAGIDDLRLYNFRQRQNLPVYACQNTLDDLSQRFAYLFNPPQLGGGVAQLDLHPLDGPFDVLGMRVVPLPARHGILDIVGFRFGDFAFMTDASEIPDSTRDLMRGCRILVLNALRHRPHSTHFHLLEAVNFAREIGAQQTRFVHITHYMDHSGTNAVLPPGMRLAHDGLTFDFEPEMLHQERSSGPFGSTTM